MRALSQADCLALWESGQALHPLDRGLLAVHAAFPGARSESVADWPLGRRNRALAELRNVCFGPSIRGWSACEQCGEKLEFEVDGEALLEGHADSTQPLQIEGKLFRLPTSRDLALIAGAQNPYDAAVGLVNRCMITSPDGDSLVEQNWNESEIEAIGEIMAQADPLAEILLHFDCPVCDSSFDQSLDLADFLWSEMESRARRLMLDVHTLASAYGWRESEILSLSPARRNFYVEAVRA